ncbi:MAG: hypothetical protein Q4F05_19930, partial [bacterium]|nr:hypothetical protein [bacterium]
IVTAKASGSSSVIISNGDLQTIVTIIVNQLKSEPIESVSNSESNPEVEESRLLTVIKSNPEETITLQLEEVEEVTSDILRYLYENNKTLVIESNQYSLVIAGKDIINFENKVFPNVELKQEKDGTTFLINEGKNLPGRIYVRFYESDMKNGKYIYLYNDGKEKYELLNTKIRQREMEIDITGTYKISESKLNTFHCNFIIIGIVVVCLLGGGITYICVAKKYWFW